VDFITNKDVLIQGYLSVVGSKIIPIGGEKAAYTASRDDPYFDVINKMKECGVSQLFEYTGENWIGKRREKVKKN